METEKKLKHLQPNMEQNISINKLHLYNISVSLQSYVAIRFVPRLIFQNKYRTHFQAYFSSL